MTRPRPRKTTPPPRPGAVISLLVVATFVVILNETVMGVALPVLMDELDVTASSAQWLTTAFLLTMAAVIPATGFLIQRFPLRTLFFTAMGLFTVGTLVAALAPDFTVLVAARVIQASGTAIMLPLTFTTVLNVIPEDRRGRMMGLISIVISVAPAIGPTASGLILSIFPWRWIFVFMIPIALIAIGLGAVWVRNLTETTAVHLDFLSVVLSAVAFGALIFGLSSVGEAANGYVAVPPWIPILVGAVTLTLFVWRQLSLRNTDRVLLNLLAFRQPTFTVALVMIVVLMSILFGVLILLPLFLQQVLGLGTLETGLILLPGGAIMGILAPIVGNLFDRYGPRPLVIPGALVASAGIWVIAFFGTGTHVWQAVLAHCILSVGLALMFTPLFTSALGSLPRHLYSHGSAIVSTLQQVAGAAGTALFIAVMSIGTASASTAGAGPIESAAEGSHLAFLVGGIGSLLVVAISVFVRAPKQSDADNR